MAENPRGDNFAQGTRWGEVFTRLDDIRRDIKGISGHLRTINQRCLDHTRALAQLHSRTGTNRWLLAGVGAALITIVTWLLTIALH